MPSTYQSILIDAPVSEVWNKLKDFHDLSWAPKVITSVQKVGDLGGAEVGARRVLNGAFHETLKEIDEQRKTLRYSIDDGPSPVSKEEVSGYEGAVRLSSSGEEGTLVEWYSSWQSPTDDAVEFCHGIYVGLLNELAESFR
jgi:hypothetical protein